MILIDPKGRVRGGDDVVVYLRPLHPEDDDGERARAVLVKRLIRRTSGYIELEQFQPARTFKLDAAEIVRIARVIPRSEERRVGKECVSTCKSRGWPYN